jgi:hypothetical protein
MKKILDRTMTVFSYLFMGRSAWLEIRRAKRSIRQRNYMMAARHLSIGYFLQMRHALSLGQVVQIAKLLSINKLAKVPGHNLLQLTDFLFSRKANAQVFVPIVIDMREEYFEALSQNRIWKARWVRIRGTWSFFAAIGLDRAFAFVSFFIKAWKSVN